MFFCDLEITLIDGGQPMQGHMLKEYGLGSCVSSRGI